MVAIGFDSATIYYRAFYAQPDVVAPDGHPNGAVRGFLDMCATLLRQFPHENVLFAWDDDWRPQWRVDLVPSYKTHRIDEEGESVPDFLGPQISALGAILDAVGVARVGEEGHEADDILAALCAADLGDTDIVTGDRDLYQLVSDARKHRVVSITRGVRNLTVVTDEVLLSDHGVVGHQYVDFATIRGDASDGLPGAKGIGPKGAAFLLSQYGDLTKILAAAADPNSELKPAARKALLEHAEYLLAAREVVKARSDATLPSLRTPAQIRNADALSELAEEWGVKAPLTRFLTALGLQP